MRVVGLLGVGSLGEYGFFGGGGGVEERLSRAVVFGFHGNYNGDVYSNSLMIRILFAFMLAYGAVTRNAGIGARRLQARPMQQQNNYNCTMPEVMGNTTILLGYCPQQVYLLPIAIGTPAQNLACIVDTGQPYLEVLTTPANAQGFTVGNSTSIDLSG